MRFYGFRLPLRLMKWCQIDPENLTKWQICCYYINLILLISLICLTLCLFKIKPFTITEITATLETLILTCHGILKFVTLHVKRSSILDLLNVTEQFWKAEELKNQRVIKEVTVVRRYMEYNVLMFYIFGLIAVAGFLIPVFFGYPLFEIYNPGLPVIFIILIQIYIIFFILYLPIIAFDSLYSLLVGSACIQFKLLNYRLLYFEEKNNIHKNIKVWVKHHNKILNFVNQINATFSTPLFFYFGIIVLSLCLELFICMTQTNIQDLIKPVVYLGAACFQFAFHYCVPGQLLISEGHQISNKCFSTRWYKKINKSKAYAMRMIIMKGQKTVKVVVGNIITLDLETCVSAFKTTFSYYMFLKTIKDKESVNVK